jgi:ABC-type glutathione transport system ATPase component
LIDVLNRPLRNLLASDPRQTVDAARGLVPAGADAGYDGGGTSGAASRPGRERMISVSHLTKEIYSSIGKRRIIDDISFDVGPGEKIAVLGRNGAGKSTLLRIIGGVEPKTSGDIYHGLLLSWGGGVAGGPRPD